MTAFRVSAFHRDFAVGYDDKAVPKDIPTLHRAAKTRGRNNSISFSVKTEHLFWGVLTYSTYFGCENKIGIASISIIFQDRLMFSHIIQKASTRAFR